MNHILIKDGVKYIPHTYGSEDELEGMIFEHYEDIFGKNSVILSKQNKKITTKSGIGTIPDAFVLSIEEKKWYIIEVELVTHPIYEHIVSQISKFSTAILLEIKITILESLI